MKYTITVLAAFFVALSVAQWPCHDYGFNGMVANCASCNVLGNGWQNAGAQSTFFSVCTNCTAGFFLNQSACVPCTANCTSCSYNGACQAGQCAPGFAWVPTNFTCLPCPASLGCQRCNYNNQGGTYSTYQNGPFACTSCPTDNYYITTAGACSACTAAGCGLSSGGALLSTATGWTGGLCGSNACSSCAVGFYSNSGVCTACGTGGSVCAGGTISACISGYYYSAASCTAVTAITGCSTYASASTCSACSGSYFFVSSTNCTQCDTTGFCTSCTNATACATCSNGGYISSASATACTACSANCTTCYSYSAVTGAPAAGLCSACKANTTLSNGVCLPCPANCTSCASTSSSATTTVCLQCQLGFGLNDTNGVCVPCPPNCDYCDGTGVCTQCRGGSWSGNTIPQVAVTSAGTVGANALRGPNVAVAQMVSQGYWLPPNQCQQCPYNCSSCANSTYCFNSCTKNYVYNATTNQCLPNGAERIVLAGFAIISVLFYFI